MGVLPNRAGLQLRGEVLMWLCALATALTLLAIAALIGLLAIRGLPHFWPDRVASVTVADAPSPFLGQWVPRSDITASADNERGRLLRLGGRDVPGQEYVLIRTNAVEREEYPEDLWTFEQRERAGLFGRLVGLRQGSVAVTAGAAGMPRIEALLEQGLSLAADLNDQIRSIERDGIDPLARALAREDSASARAELNASLQALSQERDALMSELAQLVALVALSDGRVIDLPLANVVRAFPANRIGAIGRSGIFLGRLWDFLSESPRDGNIRGGVMPAIVGTVTLVLLMTVLVTPLGVLAAVYLHEYAHQGRITAAIRIAVNNLAGVPSVVYGVFGLGFFVYLLGGEIDRLLYAEQLPGPTFGTPGMLWASLTLALLTSPVVIVATEEGLARIPRSLREGSLALGATRAETLWRVVLPAAAPAMMTGVILAIARAAGEVAPLMLVGAAKLAPGLPVDGNFPFLHLERKFMHLGYHIYDVGFQSADIDAAQPLVYATALLLVSIVVVLNLLAVLLRNRLRERYKPQENW